MLSLSHLQERRAQDSSSLLAEVCSCSETLLNLSSVRSFQIPRWSIVFPPSCAPTTFGIYHTDKSWRRSWRPTPVFLPGDSCGLGVWRATVHRVAGSLTQTKWLSMQHACTGMRHPSESPEQNVRLNQEEEAMNTHCYTFNWVLQLLVSNTYSRVYELL